MEFRGTVSLGQDSIDPAELNDRAAAIQRCAPPGAVAVVDVVKAAVQLVLPLTADDALLAAAQALDATGRALREAALPAPTSIVTVEAEAVAAAVSDSDLPPHATS